MLLLLQKDGRQFLVFEPSATIALQSVSYVAIKLYFIEFWFYFDALGYSYTPFDYQALWSLDKFENFCSSLSWYQDVFDLKVRYEQNVNECQLGSYDLTT